MKPRRIRRTFERLRREKRRAFVPFVTCGDPTPEATGPILRRLAAEGADLIELGIPFSDPMADGPVLQRAAERAIAGGTTLRTALETVQEFRRSSDVPIVLFGYANPFFRYGWDALARDAAAAGADGFLCVDLPPEEAGELDRASRREGLDLIYLLAPTSTEGRIRTVLKRARGFVYFVAVLGVTGVRANLPVDLESLVRSVRTGTDLPVGVGFGISEPEHAAAVAGYADAVVVGSALCRLIEEAESADDALARIGDLAGRLAAAVHGVTS